MYKQMILVNKAKNRLIRKKKLHQRNYQVMMKKKLKKFKK